MSKAQKLAEAAVQQDLVADLKLLSLRDHSIYGRVSLVLSIDRLWPRQRVSARCQCSSS